MEKEMRIDKWLWTARFFKTRTLASEACKAGKVKINNESVKPARIVKIGETILVYQAPLHRVIKVKQLINNRLSAKLAAELFTDLTPIEELERVQFMREMQTENRDRGVGRPTKKDRREITKLKDNMI